MYVDFTTSPNPLSCKYSKVLKCKYEDVNLASSFVTTRATEYSQMRRACNITNRAQKSPSPHNLDGKKRALKLPETLNQETPATSHKRPCPEKDARFDKRPTQIRREYLRPLCLEPGTRWTPHPLGRAFYGATESAR